MIDLFGDRNADKELFGKIHLSVHSTGKKPVPVRSRRRKKREQKELFVGDTGAGKSKLLSQVAIPHGSYCASVTVAPLIFKS